MEKNWCYQITDMTHPHFGETLWSGRYCAIAAFIMYHEGDDWYILANQRGKGTPDFQGLWNCPCGFLENNETAEEGCSRETLEETGIYVEPSKFHLLSVETDPKTCNKGHVTLRYIALVEEKQIPIPLKELKGGEKDEVADIKWINVKDIDNYQWAFNHDLVIKNGK